MTASTTYNTQVQAVCSGISSAYSTQVNFTTLSGANCTDNYETNNTKSTSKTMPVGTTINALISTTTDVDWFKFTTTSSKKNVKVTMTSLPADYDMKLYKNNSLVAISDNDGINDEQCISNNSSTRTFYVYIYGWNGAKDAADCYNLLAQTSASNFRTDGSEESAEFLSVENEFLAWPNPAQNEINIKVPFENQLTGDVSIFDISGKMLFTQTLTGSKESSTFKIDVSNFENGLYFMKWKTNTSNLVQRVIITK